MNILIFGTGWIVNAKEQKGDVQDTWADAGKAERGLGWSAKVRIQEGLGVMWRGLMVDMIILYKNGCQ